MTQFTRTARLLACTAALSLVATPAFADGWGRGRRNHDVDAGDVITGILILGGIAAVASAASNGNNSRNRNRTYEDRDYQRNRDYRENYPREQQRNDSVDYRNDTRPEWQEGRGIDSAVNACVADVERGSVRVDTVDQVSRDGQGWRIAGRTSSGGEFACAVGSDGRVRSAG